MTFIKIVSLNIVLGVLNLEKRGLVVAPVYGLVLWSLPSESSWVGFPYCSRLGLLRGRRPPQLPAGLGHMAQSEARTHSQSIGGPKE